MGHGKKPIRYRRLLHSKLNELKEFDLVGGLCSPNATVLDAFDIPYVYQMWNATVGRKILYRGFHSHGDRAREESGTASGL